MAVIRSAEREWWRRPLPAGSPALPGTSGDERPASPASPAAFWSLVGFTIILLLSPQAHFPVLVPLRIALLAVGLSIVTHVASRIARGAPVIVMSRELWLAVGLVGWAGLTAPLSLWPGGSIAVLQDQFLKSVVVFWLLSNVLTSMPRFRRMLWVLSLISVPLAATGINQYLTGSFMKRGETVVERIQGFNAPLTANPNDLALMLNLMLPLSIALFLLERRGARRLLLASTVALSVAAVIVTFSRAGFVTLASIAALYGWRLRRRPERRWAWAALALAVACLPLLPATYLDRIATMTDISKDETGSAAARWDDNLAALRLVLKNPVVGYGMGSDTLALNAERGDTWSAIHNVYLQYAIDLGLPGLGLFLAILFGCLRRLNRRISDREPSAELAALLEGVQVSLLGFAVAALFYPVAYHFYFFYIAGLAVALVQMPPARRVDAGPAGETSRGAGR